MDIAHCSMSGNDVCFLPCLQALMDHMPQDVWFLPCFQALVNDVCFLPCLQALVDGVLQYV